MPDLDEHISRTRRRPRRRERRAALRALAANFLDPGAKPEGDSDVNTMKDSEAGRR